MITLASKQWAFRSNLLKQELLPLELAVGNASTKTFWRCIPVFVNGVWPQVSPLRKEGQSEDRPCCVWNIMESNFLALALKLTGESNRRKWFLPVWAITCLHKCRITACSVHHPLAIMKTWETGIFIYAALCALKGWFDMKLEQKRSYRERCFPGNLKKQ